MKKDIQKIFPNLNDTFEITSPVDNEYNCIAWAAGDTERWWWPDLEYTSYWPPNIERKETLISFIEAFKALGYEVTDSPEQKNGYEKIAIYTKKNTNSPTHASRQLKSGNWTSKIGSSHDIEHDLHGVDGEIYGEIAVIMERSIQH